MGFVLGKCSESAPRAFTETTPSQTTKCNLDANQTPTANSFTRGVCGPHRGRSCAGQSHSQSSVTKTLLSFTKPYITTTCGAGQSHSRSVTQTLIFHETLHHQNFHVPPFCSISCLPLLISVYNMTFSMSKLGCITLWTSTSGTAALVSLCCVSSNGLAGLQDYST